MINKNQVYKAFYETIASGESNLHYIKGVLDISKKLLSIPNQENNIGITVPNQPNLSKEYSYV